jgi:hypothetical protein
MIFFECYADESLLRYIGFTSGNLKGGHSNGRSKVSSKLKNSVSKIALIDEDPGAPKDPYLDYLFSLEPTYSDRYCISIIDLNTNNKLIVLRPNLETWSVNIARDKKIDLEDYGLVNDGKNLHKILRIERNERKRKKFIEFISDAASHPAIIKLKELMN